jgi:hypothetical protein
MESAAKGAANQREANLIDHVDAGEESEEEEH